MTALRIFLMFWVLTLPAQATTLPVQVSDAADGSLRLRDVEAQVREDVIEVSGRVHRSLLTRVIAGRVISARVLAADGHERLRQRIAVPVARLAPRGGGWATFTLRLPLQAAPDDVVMLSIPAPGAAP